MPNPYTIVDAINQIVETVSEFPTNSQPSASGDTTSIYARAETFLDRARYQVLALGWPENTELSRPFNANWLGQVDVDGIMAAQSGGPDQHRNLVIRSQFGIQRVYDANNRTFVVTDTGTTPTAAASWANGSEYFILALSSTSAAQWQAVGLPVGATPAVGQRIASYIGTTAVGGGGTVAAFSSAKKVYLDAVVLLTWSDLPLKLADLVIGKAKLLFQRRIQNGQLPDQQLQQEYMQAEMLADRNIASEKLLPPNTRASMAPQVQGGQQQQQQGG